jgi:hypothetical protein
MMSVHILHRIQGGIIPGCRDDCYPATTICTPTNEEVVIIFKEIVIHEQKESISVLREDADSGVE